MSRGAVLIENLYVYQHNKKILGGISLEANEGDVVCVFGSTGSGKTTLLKTLVGLTQSIYARFKVYGNIWVFGYKPEEALIKGLTAYVPQDVYNFFVGRTPEEELAIVNVNKSREIPGDLGLELGKKIYELSDGQLYRLLMVSAIACGAKVIAVDEPSSHIDWWNLEEVLNYLRDFVIGKNLVVFIADHRTDKVKKICSKYINLDNVSTACSLPKVASSKENNVVASLEDIDFCYDNNCVLRKISMEIRGGEAIAIVGRNGVGKTTLLRVIAGLAKPSRGKVKFYSKPRVFIVPQNPVYWFPNKPLEKVIKLFMDMLEVEEHVEDVLAMFSLGRYVSYDAYSLSVGLARVLSIALAYASRADLVLIDEPTLGLDCVSKQIVVEAINKLIDKGCSIVVATHDMDFAKLFNRVYILDRGVLRSFDNAYSYS